MNNIVKILSIIAVLIFVSVAGHASVKHGEIHTIWFDNEGRIPEEALEHLRDWSFELRYKLNELKFEPEEKLHYSLYLWTERDRLDPRIIERLGYYNVAVCDIHELLGPPIDAIKRLIFTGHWTLHKFYYAVASDILRIELMRLIPRDKVFIYMDVLDSDFTALAKDLRKLHDSYEKGHWPAWHWSGFSLPYIHFGEDKVGLANTTFRDFNNDLIIAIKDERTAGPINAFVDDYMGYTLAALPHFENQAIGEDNIFNLVLDTSNPSHAFQDCIIPGAKMLRSWKDPVIIPNSYGIIGVKGGHAQSWVPKKQEALTEVTLPQIQELPAILFDFESLSAVIYGNAPKLERKLIDLLKSVEKEIALIDEYRKQTYIVDFYPSMLAGVEKIREIAFSFEKSLRWENDRAGNHLKSSILKSIGPIKFALQRYLRHDYTFQR